MDSETWKIARGVALGIVIAVVLIFFVASSCQAEGEADQCREDNIDRVSLNLEPIDCG